MFDCLEKIKEKLLDLAPSVKIGLENGIKNAKSVPFIRIVSFNDEIANYNTLNLNFNVYIAVKKTNDLENDYKMIENLAIKVRKELHLKQIFNGVIYYKGSIDDNDETPGIKVKILHFSIEGILW